ncbi:hypothetical protein I307_01001 [Cryptococcus deuterogattii 99/473]|uniref:Major facilitator superfamily (MFS) profile domain-containing protein n=1 Tax=Cryptococcus deuterogattii Ram5 TaxID=1296110 RepID=A0A0D0U3C3_9TREE|nr:hypothetical protein I313_00855 [Cryptococcus deuterogattii Ram5]KIY59333.1 hypothetical protein I307_01001 [Cryptococcus deuterogattii 99/473]
MSNQPVALPMDMEGTLEYTPSRHSQETLHKSQYVFKRQKKEMPLPSKRMTYIMLLTISSVSDLDYQQSSSSYLPSLVSVIWIMNFVGFMIAGLTNVLITDRFGFGIAAPFGSSMQAVAYALICWGCPYPLFLIAYIFNGFGLGLQDAQVNSLTSRLPNSSTKMFLMHAWYGFGATISPFVSTAFVQHIPQRVYLYFAVSLGLAIITAIALVAVFHLRTDDQIVGKREETDQDSTDSSEVPAAVNSEGQVIEKKPKHDSSSKMKRIMKTPVVHCMAFYMVIYVGVEVTIGGWATSFLIDERGGDDNAGYVSAGYFGGLTLGRVALIPVSKWLGPHISIWLYTLLSIALSIIIWVTHSIVGNAICFSFIGVFLGPMYPLVMNVVVDILPGELQGGTIGWIASLGQAGSAVMPFTASGSFSHWSLLS